MLLQMRNAAFLLANFLSAICLVHADPTALWLEPSTKWYGIDGNWSSMSLYVGDPGQQVDVTVSTSLSEIWVVENTGCGSSPLCAAARGNVFNISASSTWSSLGPWELGLDYLQQDVNGDYAMEMVTTSDSLNGNRTSLGQQVVAAINDTAYYTGFFGLGITPGRFKATVVQSPIAALVERDGIVPSHSYGYTAGAYYGGQYGTPMSLVLGGYDQKRFVSHDTAFSLNSTTRQPEALIRAITVFAGDIDQAPPEWNSTAQSLSSFDESVVALVDSSTPYLWLPAAICDNFANALNLTWNETFGVYLFTNTDTYTTFSGSDLAFTFTLSSTDNRDNLGDPLNVAGVVNITISAKAFAQTLRYPFKNLFNYGDAAVPYFPLKRTDNATQIIIGRSFLQEAYMKMNYEQSTFSLHQALFPENPVTNTTIVTLRSSEDNPYPDVGSASGSKQGLSVGAIVGIVVGAGVVLLTIAIIVGFVQYRRKKNRAAEEPNSLKDSSSSFESEPPRTPVGRMFSRFTRRLPGKKSKRNLSHEISGDTTQPVEAAGQERYELAAPLAPIELDAADTHSINGTTEFGTDETRGVSAYELAKRRMEKQLQGPVPQYTPGPSPTDAHATTYEKGYQDVSPVPHHRPSSRSLRSDNRSLSPASTPTHENYSYSIPSPMSPHGDWAPSMMPNIPSSPVEYYHNTTLPRSASNPGSAYTMSSSNILDHRPPSRSASSGGSFASGSMHLALPQHSYQRTPIDPSKVVCLGPLPAHVRPPNQTPTSRLHISNGHTFALPTIPSAVESRRQSTTDTLGSDFTFDEEEHMGGEMEHDRTFGAFPSSERTIEEEESNLHSAPATGTLDGFDLVHIPEPPTPVSATPNTSRLESRVDIVHVPTPVDPTVVSTSSRQRLNGFDLVHVPQPAEQRYSWEESRTR